MSICHDDKHFIAQFVGIHLCEFGLILRIFTFRWGGGSVGGVVGGDVDVIGYISGFVLFIIELLKQTHISYFVG